MYYESTSYFNNPERNAVSGKNWREFYRQFLLPRENNTQAENPLSKLTTHSLVSTLTLDIETPIKIAAGTNEHFCLFTSKEKEDRFLDSKNKFKGTIERQLENKIERYKPKTYQLSEFLHSVASQDKVEMIRVNPVYSPFDESVIFHEEVLFAPCFDPVTQKYLMSCPDEAKALLALNNDDLKRFGVEIIFHCFTNRSLPEELEQRDNFLLKNIDELNFFVPRTPIKNGSASLYCIILNLGNPFIETAFIRNYQTFNKNSDVVFITSNLEIVTENYETISYDPSSIETILRPLIDWQSSK